MFSNAKQQIPERFIEKMALDKEYDTELKKVRDLKIVPIDEIHTILDPLRIKRRQVQEKSAECQAFIASKKARGPTA